MVLYAIEFPIELDCPDYLMTTRLHLHFGGASVGMRGGLHLGIGPTSCDPRSIANDLGLTNLNTSYLTDRHRPSQVRIVAIPCRETD